MKSSLILNISTSFFFFLTFLYFFTSNATPSIPKEALPTKTGYLPINSTSKSAIFYTYYEAQKPIYPLPQTPILIWLQGGPGCSSMFGNFYELGPWRVTSSYDKDHIPILKPNPGSWNNLFGLLFIDNPIGTGFSIASTTQEIPKDQETVGKHLFIAIRKFVTLNPSFNSRPIYITGESYAGKFVPAIGYYILHQNSKLRLSQQVNLKGVAIGNGMTDPITQVATHAVIAYYIGLINEKQRLQLEEFQSAAVKFVQEGKWSNATDARRKVLSTLRKMTGLATLDDYRRKKPYRSVLVDEFLANKEVKKALGFPISINWKRCNNTVADVLHEDVMKSVKFMVEELLKKTKVLLYQGQFDLRDGVATTEAWIKTLKWEGLEKFLNAERIVWTIKGMVAGYVQRWGSLSEVMVSDAGHYVPADQAVSSQAMIQDWVLERGLYVNQGRGHVPKL
ncbi:Carboxypeptidase [Thalictrum thalictroides]|uniref:Carboxypeptidase n=1 Tax=Thalictrum thalictroides TaxID=46969 RepID=A0A7J6USP6_THATH|nr:Carboxypeptidase [Thalictrum thalictroides]